MTSAFRTGRIELSVHDTAPVWSGETAATALRQSLDLAVAAEELGYRRYWVAEHHSTPALATSTPAVLAGQILARTQSIRVGSGAVLLPNHPPLVIAEQFGLLASLYPDRVDLGLGRGAGGGAAAVDRLGRTDESSFERKFDELARYFRPGSDPDGVRAVPEPHIPPALWIVGSSTASALFAGKFGLPYVYAHAIAPGGAAEALRVYRRVFRPSTLLAEPHAGIAAIVVVADTDEKADSSARAFVLGQIRMRTVDANGVLPVEAQALAHTFTAAESEFARERMASQLIGSLDAVSRKVSTLLWDSGADELFALSQIPDFSARVHSYELLAKLGSGRS